MRAFGGRTSSPEILGVAAGVVINDGLRGLPVTITPPELEAGSALSQVSLVTSASTASD